MASTIESPSSDAAMNLIDIWLIVWRSKWFVILTTVLFTGLAVFYAVTAKPWYRAEVLLKVAENKQSQGMFGQLGSIGGLASLAGLDVGANKSAEPIAVLKSRELAASFIEEQNLLPVFFADKWDSSAGRWKSQDVREQPDIRDGIKFFQQSIVKVLEDKKTGLITVTVDWTDAKVATAWANLIVQRVNERMRQRALTEGERSMNFLKQELGATSLVPLQQSVGRVIEAQLQQLILAKSNEEYAFRIIDHAQVPKYRDHPKRSVVIGLALFAGIALSSMLLLARHVIRRARIERSESLVAGPNLKL